MDPDKAILVKIFGNAADADLAAGQLRAAGVECSVTSDDCAEMYPTMGVIQLRVAAEDAVEARRLLNEPAAPTVDFAQSGAADPPVNPPATRVFRFNCGLLAGTVLGILLHLAFTNRWQLHDFSVKQDYDGDGTPDAEEVWKKGELIEWRRDRNADGRPDIWTRYREGYPYYDEIDDNFDGKPDSTLRYGKRQNYVSQVSDTDFNGVPDLYATFTNGLLYQSDWRPNASKTILLRQRFRDNVLQEELHDVNADGWFDVSVKFDRFNTPIQTNNLRPTTSAP